MKFVIQIVLIDGIVILTIKCYIDASAWGSCCVNDIAASFSVEGLMLIPLQIM